MSVKLDLEVLLNLTQLLYLYEHKIMTQLLLQLKDYITQSLAYKRIVLEQQELMGSLTLHIKYLRFHRKFFVKPIESVETIFSYTQVYLLLDVYRS